MATSSRFRLAAALVFLLACSKEDPAGVAGAGGQGGARGQATDAKPDGPTPAQLEEFARSRVLWAEAKGREGPDYIYVSRRTVYPTGIRFETIIEVRADRVVRRSYGVVGEAPKWVETGADIDTHSEHGFAPDARAYTMEQLFEACERDVLSANPVTNTIGFGFGPDGLLTSCWQQRRGCADSCGSGHVISELTFID